MRFSGALLEAVQECRPARPDFFLRQGVHPCALESDPAPHVGFPVLASRVAITGAHRFEFESLLQGDADFQHALVIPARDEFGGVVDLVAWVPGRAGLASWSGRVCLLGEHWAHSSRLGEPLHVFPNALEWLKAGRRGVVVIEPHKAAILLHGVTLLVDDPAFGFELRNLLSIAPNIVVRANALRRAA